MYQLFSDDILRINIHISCDVMQVDELELSMKSIFLFFAVLTFVSFASAQGTNYLPINYTDFMLFDTSNQNNYAFFEISEAGAFTIRSGQVGNGENFWQHPPSSGRLLHSDPESGIPKLKTGLHKAADMVFLEASGRVTVYNQYLQDTTHIFLTIQDYGNAINLQN
jgi:hypothetical protein